MSSSSSLIQPHGGSLSNLIVSPNDAHILKSEAVSIPSLTLTQRQLCDIELLMNGGFSPLTGFLARNAYESVVNEMRMPDGTLWPMPITLDVDAATAAELEVGGKVALRDRTGLILAILTIQDVWKINKRREAENVFDTTDESHPAVDYLFNQAGDFYVGGPIEGIQLPRHYDFRDLRSTPTQLRAQFKAKSWERIIAFQTRNPMHRAHKELTDRAAEDIGGHLLLHPVVGMTKPGDIDHFTRVRCYKKILSQYEHERAALSLLPLAMRMAGPREALWHAIIRKNYGCTHFIIGRDHAGCSGADNSPIYGPYEAQNMVASYSDEIGIKVVPFRLMLYSKDTGGYKAIDEVVEGEKTLKLSGTELRRRLQTGEPIPEWFSYPEVVETLRKSYPTRERQGLTVFLTGLSGSGKSTIANALKNKLHELTDRPITLLDGDLVRRHLSNGLGFSKEDRSVNVRRIGYVASEITKHGGIAICAPIAPYESDRMANRQLIESTTGGYIEVSVDCPLEICEKRDVKGLYAKARAGVVKDFTGIDDPYEPPLQPELVCHTANETIDESVENVVDKIASLGFLGSVPRSGKDLVSHSAIHVQNGSSA